jgi:hypothetical protein
LLTVVMHELGRTLGLTHDQDGVMAETLAAGVRRAESEHHHVASVDHVLGQSGEHHADTWLGAWLDKWLESTQISAKRRRQ